jgi:hypothetical protein
MIVRWENPPPVHRWVPIVEALQERPGEWALIAEGLGAKQAENWRCALRDRGVEIAVRKISEVGSSVWGRFPGDRSSDPQAGSRTIG